MQAAAERLDELGVPVKRPPDYYAEMARAWGPSHHPALPLLLSSSAPVHCPDPVPTLATAPQVKNDEHMRKVREKLIVTQKAVEAKAERKQQREQKKYAKEVQVQKQKERKAQQKADAAMLHKMKKKGVGADGAEGARAFALSHRGRTVLIVLRAPCFSPFSNCVFVTSCTVH